MACDEIDKAFAWAKQTSAHEQFLVTAFFTKHQGVLTEPNTPQVGRGADYCWYAVGEVTLSAAGHLVGDLQLYAVSSSPQNVTDAITMVTDGTVGVDISPGRGTVSYVQKLKGKPVLSMPPTQVTTTCLGGVLLTGTNKTEVIAVGLRRDLSPVPW